MVSQAVQFCFTLILTGRTVLTPQRHLPSVPTLTLKNNFGTFSLAWPLPLATTHHHVHHP